MILTGCKSSRRIDVPKSGETFIAKNSEISHLAGGVRGYGTFHLESGGHVQGVPLPSVRYPGPTPTVTGGNVNIGGRRPQAEPPCVVRNPVLAVSLPDTMCFQARGPRPQTKQLKRQSCSTLGGYLQGGWHAGKAWAKNYSPAFVGKGSESIACRILEPFSNETASAVKANTL